MFKRRSVRLTPIETEGWGTYWRTGGPPPAPGCQLLVATTNDSQVPTPLALAVARAPITPMMPLMPLPGSNTICGGFDDPPPPGTSVTE